MSIPEYMKSSFYAKQVSTLAFSCVKPDNAMGIVRALSWHNLVLRLGISFPLFFVHDFGHILMKSGKVNKHGDDLNALHLPKNLYDWYRSFLEEVSRSELSEAVSSWRLRDDLMAVLLVKLLAEVHERWPERREWVGANELPLDPNLYQGLNPREYLAAFDQKPVRSLFNHLQKERLYLLTAIELIDLDTLRVLGLFRGQGMTALLADIADLLGVFSSPVANGVVNFSMELLPSVLETRRQSGVQTFSIDGYASIERHGNIDSIVLSEFAYDDDVFIQKVVDNELYYYGHEKQDLEERSLHYILVDSSASMRGEREVFARGLALTLSKKLSLLGHEVWLRFFDSRLYSVLKMNKNAESAVPHLLCFKSERGRNYDRVFQTLASEIKRMIRREKRQVVIYMITHGQCHVRNELIKELANLVELYGVFILPSSHLHLDYLSDLHRYQIVGHDVFTSKERKVDRALEIVDDASTISKEEKTEFQKEEDDEISIDAILRDLDQELRA